MRVDTTATTSMSRSRQTSAMLNGPDDDLPLPGILPSSDFPNLADSSNYPYKPGKAAAKRRKQLELQAIQRAAEIADAHPEDHKVQDAIKQSSQTDADIIASTSPGTLEKVVMQAEQAAQDENVSQVAVLSAAMSQSDVVPSDLGNGKLPVINEETVETAKRTTKAQRLMLRACPRKIVNPDKKLTDAVYEWQNWLRDNHSNDLKSAFEALQVTKTDLMLKDKQVKDWKNSFPEVSEPQVVEYDDGTVGEETRFYHEVPKFENGRIDYKTCPVDVKKLSKEQREMKAFENFLWMGEKIQQSGYHVKDGKVVFNPGSWVDEMKKCMLCTNKLWAELKKTTTVKAPRRGKGKSGGKGGSAAKKSKKDLKMQYTSTLHESPHMLTAIHIQQKQRQGTGSAALGRQAPATRRAPPSTTPPVGSASWMARMGL